MKERRTGAEAGAYHDIGKAAAGFQQMLREVMLPPDSIARLTDALAALLH